MHHRGGRVAFCLPACPDGRTPPRPSCSTSARRTTARTLTCVGTRGCFAAHHVSAALAGARAAYAGARRELGDAVDPETLSAAMRALEEEGARLARAARDVELIEEALRGTRWRPRI